MCDCLYGRTSSIAISHLREDRSYRFESPSVRTLVAPRTEGNSEIFEEYASFLVISIPFLEHDEAGAKTSS